ncbi:MAG: IclR family transcriptional regulator [Jejuia sp.]
MKTEQKLKYNAPALDKGLDILEFLSKEGVPLTQLEIAQGINRTPSEIYRMLVCLEERGYLNRGSNAGKYRLSLKMYNLSHSHTPFDELRRVSQKPMYDLSEKTKQSSHLSILNDNQLMVISQVRGPGVVSLSIEEGAQFSLALTTSGKVLLSQIPQTQRENILSFDKHFNKLNKAEQKEFYRLIDEVKTKGYHYSKSSMTTGVTDIAFPIGKPEDAVNSALAISMLTSNFEVGMTLEEILSAMNEAQNEINALIGYIEASN